MENLRLTVVDGPYQRTLVEGILQDAGIPHLSRETSALSVALGIRSSGGLDSGHEFLVPADRLGEAKDLLCAQGVVCEVSERLLRRSLEEIIRPLLAADPECSERSWEKLQRFVEINNKETVRALFASTLREGGGRELLEDLFFHLARAGSPALRPLARALQEKSNAAFGERFHAEATRGEKDLRLVLLDTLPDVPRSSWRIKALAVCLLDRDLEIRESAGEALFAISGSAYEYDVDDPPAEREAVVKALLADAKRI